MTAPSKRIRYYKAALKQIGQAYPSGVCLAFDRVAAKAIPRKENETENQHALKSYRLARELSEEFNKLFRPANVHYGYWMGGTSGGVTGPGNRRRIRALTALIDTLGTDPVKRKLAQRRIKKIVAEVNAYNRREIFA